MSPNIITLNLRTILTSQCHKTERHTTKAIIFHSVLTLVASMSRQLTNKMVQG